MQSSKGKACAFPFHKKCTTSSSNNNSNSNKKRESKKKWKGLESYHTLDESMGSNKTHSFSVSPFHSPGKCKVCNELIIGLGTLAFKCQMCKYGPVHRKCKVPKTCSDMSYDPVSTATVQLKEEVVTLRKRIQELETKKQEEGEYQQQHNTTTTSTQLDRCVVCYENKINCVLLECGHRALCMQCGQQLRECPMCRRPIERIVRVYDAY